jgi:hypothetical protein
MRWHDMMPDKAYALTGKPRVKVTVLDTPAEVRAKARVRVRFETGVAAGRVLDIPSQRVAAPWEGARVQKPAPRRRRTEAPVLLLSRQAGVGDTATLEETGELLWTVDAVDYVHSTATISTVIFERPDTRTVARDRLQVRGKQPQRASRRRTERPSRRPPIDAEDAAAERLRPIAPRRELDELMDDLLFTRACVRDYERRLGSDSAARQSSGCARKSGAPGTCWAADNCRATSTPAYGSTGALTSCSPASPHQRSR